MQVNIELLKTFGGRRFMKKLIKNNCEIVFRSDANNLADRKPDYILLKKHIKEDLMIKSDNILQQHIKKYPDGYFLFIMSNYYLC